MGKKKQKKKARKALFSFARLLHVYTSTSLFVLMILFCLTGITLNHRWYHSDGNQISELSDPLENAILEEWGLLPDWNPDITKISADIKERYRLDQPYSIDLDDEFKEVVLEYKVPAGFATVSIQAEENIVIVEKESGSLLGILNDLHKGRHSGTAWSWVIDISAALMILFSITGLIILYQGKRFKKWGNLTLAAGLISPLLIYWCFVPSV